MDSCFISRKIIKINPGINHLFSEDLIEFFFSHCPHKTPPEEEIAPAWQNSLNLFNPTCLNGISSEIPQANAFPPSEGD